MGCRCALRPSGDAHEGPRLSASKTTSCGRAARSPVAHWPRGRGRERPPNPRAWYGFGGRCVCAPLPPTLRVAPIQQSLCGKASSAADSGGAAVGSASGSSTLPTRRATESSLSRMLMPETGPAADGRGRGSHVRRGRCWQADPASEDCRHADLDDAGAAVVPGAGPAERTRGR